jgi:hypothetical protein
MNGWVIGFRLSGRWLLFNALFGSSPRRMELSITRLPATVPGRLMFGRVFKDYDEWPEGGR